MKGRYSWVAVVVPWSWDIIQWKREVFSAIAVEGAVWRHTVPPMV
jgi:hypothetical protein